jgi:HlyD family secretion protein
MKESVSALGSVQDSSDVAGYRRLFGDDRDAHLRRHLDESITSTERIPGRNPNQAGHRGYYRFMRGKWLFIAGPILLLAVAGAAWSIYRRTSAQKPSAQAATAPKPVTPAQPVSLTGRIEARKVVLVAAPIDGIVDALFAEMGQEVQHGQLLARVKSARLGAVVEDANSLAEGAQSRLNDIETSIISARLENSRATADATRAKNEFEQADKAFQRQSMLMKEGATPRLVFEKAQREYETAKQDNENKSALLQQAESRLEALTREREAAKRALDEKSLTLDQAKADVSSGDLVSPVDGVVVGRHGQPGEEVSPTTTDFFQIAVELGSLSVAVEPPPPVLARIRPGQHAFVHLAEYPEDLPGSVREIRGTQAIVDFTSPSAVIRPGLTANVRIVLD